MPTIDTPITRASTDLLLHRRIATDLHQHIADGQLTPGTLLPPEVDLARQDGVSRHAVRAALAAIVHAGLIERRRGKGTVTIRPRMQQNLARFYSVTREMRQRGVHLQTRALAHGHATSGDDLSEAAALHLRVVPEEVGCVMRLRLIEGTPLILEFLTFPVAVYPILTLQPPAVPGDDPGTASIYDLLIEQAHLTVTHAHETFPPVSVAGYEARLLGVATGTAVFEVERTGDANGRIVEWRRSLVRGNRYAFSVDLEHPADDDAIAPEGADV